MSREHENRKPVNGWLDAEAYDKFEAELKTFGGENQKEQFITWKWYFHARATFASLTIADGSTRS